MVSKAQTTRKIALTAVLASVYFVLRSTPNVLSFQMVGTTGRFTAADFLLTIIALIAGPWNGAIAVLIGTIAAYGITPPIFYGLDFLPAIANVVTVGLITSRHRRTAWVGYSAMLAAFIASPYSLLFGYDYVPYTWLHIVAFGVLLSPVSERIPSMLVSGGRLQTAAILSLGFIGTMAQHLAGGLLFEGVVGVAGGISPLAFRKLFWEIIFWIYPVERLIIVALSTIIAVPIYRAVRSMNLV